MQTKTYPARNLMGARYDGKHSYFTVQPHGSNTLRVAACCAALLLACWSHSSNGQPASQQLALTTRSPNITLHNYTLAGQALYTVCPCKDNWQYRLQNGTLLQLYGCANPENDPAGPFCEIDPRGASCPSSETLSMNIAGRGRRLVVPCLPERKRTISGCLCSSFWSERDGVNFRMQWPILPRDELQRGLHEGWLLAGNCSAALALPGGPRCLVVEGSCTNTPAKAYPPPTPNQFWQITSADAQGWDFCSDPTYESQRAQQPNSTGELLRNLPANVQASVQMTTQAGCVCSPGNWTYYPSQIAQAGQPLQSFLGCTNPDADPKGAWCPVDPVTCPSHYGAKQPEKPGDVPRDMWYNRVYFDYCEEVRNKTEAGCLCLGNWKPTFNSTLEARPNENGLGIRPDPSKITVISGGACSNPSQLQRDRDWCFVDYNTCNRRPAGVAGSTNELHWDYCAGAAPIGIAAPATPIATLQQQETGGGSPKADIIGPVVAAAGLAAVVFGVLMWRRYRRYQKLTSLQWVERHMPGMPFLQQQQRDIELGGPGRGGMQDYNGHDAIGKDSTSSTDPLRPRSPWDVGDMFAFKKKSNDQQQQYRHGNTSYRIQHGVDAPVRPGFVAAAAASEAAAAAPIREMKSVIVASKGASSLDGSSKMSQIPLMTQQSNYVSSSKEGQYMAAAAAAAGRGQQSLWMNQSAARSDGTSDSGLPNSVGLLGNLTEPTTKGSAAAAAAAAAEQRAAALAALWDSETFSCFVAAADKSPAAAAAGAGGDSEPAQDTAAAAAAADTDGSVSRRQRQRQRHRYAASDGSHVARAISSPFASKDSSLLASLESYPPVVIDDNSTAGTSTTAAAAASYEGQEQQQQQQQGELASEESEEQPEGSVNIPLPIRTYTPNAPKTPSHEDSSRFAPSPSNAAAAAAAAPAAAAADASVRPQSTVQAGSSSSRVSWMLRSTTPVSEEYQTGDEDALDESMISGLTGMMTATGETIRHPEPSSTTATSAAAAATGSRSKTSSKAAPGLHRSIEAPGTCHMSGAMLDGNWDFEKVNDKPVRVLLQVTEEVDVTHPVTLLLLVSAPPPKPEVLSTIVLPKDPPQAGVDLGMDAKRDLAFPTNSFLGKGAFGQVHRALLRNRHPVAVKMLTDPDLRAADQETLKCFREELMILAKLDHTHILRCYGGNLDVVNPFIVTELCECSLDKMISHYQRKTGSGLPLKHTLTIGLHIASALWHLHPSIVHRDLKPQNILLDMNGTAKVADFGLSRIKTHTFVSTHHVEAGTAAYMAPECFGSAGVGEKVDVYALGMLLWECVTGVRPWKGCNMVQIAFQVAMQGNRPPLPAANPGRCPVELTQLMADCWAANPKERPSSGEVMKALAHLIRVYVPDH